jgi:hypothetical protein
MPSPDTTDHPILPSHPNPPHRPALPHTPKPTSADALITKSSTSMSYDPVRVFDSPPPQKCVFRDSDPESVTNRIPALPRYQVKEALNNPLSCDTLTSQHPRGSLSLSSYRQWLTKIPSPNINTNLNNNVQYPTTVPQTPQSPVQPLQLRYLFFF